MAGSASSSLPYSPLGEEQHVALVSAGEKALEQETAQAAGPGPSPLESEKCSCPRQQGPRLA